MDSGILKSIVVILFFFAGLFASFLLGVMLTKTNTMTDKPEILGDLDFSTRFYCEKKQYKGSDLANKSYSLQHKCELINNPKVKFMVSINCKKERDGFLCLSNVTPFKEEYNSLTNWSNVYILLKH